MPLVKKKKATAKARNNGAGTIDLEKFRAELSEEGKELFDIAMSVPKEELLSNEEISRELARRRGGIVYLKKQKKPRPKPRQPSAAELEKFRESLSDAGKDLFDIAFGMPDDPEDLMTIDEILAEVARRRGGMVIVEE